MPTKQVFPCISYSYLYLREAAGLSFLFSNIFFFAELLSFAFLFSADEVNLVFFLMSFLVKILPFLGVVLPFLATTLDFSFGACFSSELEELESLRFLEPLDTLAFFLGGAEIKMKKIL